MDKKKYDAEYISYVESGESAAVFIARDIAVSIDTSGMWIDVLNHEGNKNKNGRWDFRYFEIELFPRKHNPIYPEYASEEDKKYITWKTAHEDITEQRRCGYRGTRFGIKPKLVNRNKDNSCEPKWEYTILSVNRL